MYVNQFNKKYGNWSISLKCDDRTERNRRSLEKWITNFHRDGIVMCEIRGIVMCERKILDKTAGISEDNEEI